MHNRDNLVEAAYWIARLAIVYSLWALVGLYAPGYDPLPFTLM
jgi:hypothetical protein